MLNSLTTEQRREYQRLRPRDSQGKDHSGPFRLPFEGNSMPLKGLTEKGVVVFLCSFIREENGLSRKRLEAGRLIRKPGSCSFDKYILNNVGLVSGIIKSS